VSAFARTPASAARGARRKGARHVLRFLAGSLFVLAAAAPSTGAGRPGEAAEAPPLGVEAAGIRLPAGFTATLFADGLGPGRHIVVRENGDVYLALRQPVDGKGVIGLRDVDGDGRADETARFGATGGTGIAIHDGYLYFSSDVAVFRAKLDAKALAPTGNVETVVRDFPRQSAHAAKSIALDDEGRLYVNSGAPSNACQERDRTIGSPGMPDCPLLARQGGVWRFPAGRTGMTQTADGTRFATGIRNAVALGWNPLAKRIFLLQHGRDQLGQLYPDSFTAEQSARLPAEELHRIEEGSDVGWPYTYWDAFQKARVVAPEYGGDGRTKAPAGKYQDPLVAFPAHWGPNAIHFYRGKQLPERYRGGAFVVFHGSWNRAPYAQEGYNVAFVPFAGGVPSGGWEFFADGFAGVPVVENPQNAQHRPTGIAEGPDGSLYVSDSVKGRIWRIRYTGEASDGASAR